MNYLGTEKKIISHYLARNPLLKFLIANAQKQPWKLSDIHNSTVGPHSPTRPAPQRMNAERKVALQQRQSGTSMGASKCCLRHFETGESGHLEAAVNGRTAALAIYLARTKIPFWSFVFFKQESPAVCETLLFR
jgi:hypothetical protein